MLQFKAPQDLDSLPDSHPAYSLVQELINHLIVNFPEDRPYYPQWIVSGKPLHRPLSIWCLVWIVRESSVTMDGLSGNSVLLSKDGGSEVTASEGVPKPNRRTPARGASGDRGVPAAILDDNLPPRQHPFSTKWQFPELLAGNRLVFGDVWMR